MTSKPMLSLTFCLERTFLSANLLVLGNQMAPFAEMTLARISSDGLWKAKAILIVICPLVSLMKDQVKQMQEIGISAAYVGSDQAEPVLRKVEEGHFTLVAQSDRKHFWHNDSKVGNIQSANKCFCLSI